MFGIEVALHELGVIERRHVAVVAALHLVAEHERHAGRAMIRAGAIVAHAPAELREDEDDHVVRFVMRPEVGHERLEALGQLGPEARVQRVLARMRVVAA